MKLEIESLRLDSSHPFKISRNTRTTFDLFVFHLRYGDVSGIGEAAPQQYYGENPETVREAVDAIEGLLDGDPAELLGSPDTSADASSAAPVDPNLFRVGMAVVHPEYGPGKVAALSGQGARRTGTISFATAGEKKFVLSKCPLRPLV